MPKGGQLMKKDTAVAVVIALALVASLATSNYNSGVQNNRVQSLSFDNSAVNNTMNDGIVQGPAPDFPPLTLHSVAGVEKALNMTLILPSSATVSSISPSLKLL